MGFAGVQFDLFGWTRPWAIMDACLVIVALLPAHDSNNGEQVGT